MTLPFDLTPLDLVLLIPAFAVVVLAFVPNYRLGAVINVLAAGATFAASVILLTGERVRSDILIVDDFNIYLVTLTTFVGFTTSIFSASYIGHELETGRLTPTFLRFYHALYQAMIGAMNVALVANNIGLLWVGVEVATLSTVMMVGIYRTPEAVEAAWKYFILGSVGIALAFFGTILVYLAAQETAGRGAAGDGVGPARARTRRSSIRSCCRSPSCSCWSAMAPRSASRRSTPGCPTRMPKARRRSRRCCRACCSTSRSTRCCASR